MALKAISHPQVSIAQCGNSGTQQSSPSLSMTYLEDILRSVASRCLYEANTEQLRKRLSEYLDNAAKKFNESSLSDQISIELDETSIPMATDPLADECESYQEYTLKKAVTTGDTPTLSKHQFDMQKSFDPNSLPIKITVSEKNSPIEMTCVNISAQL